jgi:hypothetical protein
LLDVLRERGAEAVDERYVHSASWEKVKRV